MQAIAVRSQGSASTLTRIIAQEHYTSTRPNYHTTTTGTSQVRASSDTTSIVFGHIGTANVVLDSILEGIEP